MEKEMIKMNANCPICTQSRNGSSGCPICGFDTNVLFLDEETENLARTLAMDRYATYNAKTHATSGAKNKSQFFAGFKIWRTLDHNGNRLKIWCSIEINDGVGDGTTSLRWMILPGKYTNCKKLLCGDVSHAVNAFNNARHTPISNWRLPTLDEFLRLYYQPNKQNFGLLVNESYWMFVPYTNAPGGAESFNMVDGTRQISGDQEQFGVILVS